MRRVQTIVISSMLAVALLPLPGGATESASVESLKRQIVDLARTFEGQGDEDFSRQSRLNVLVAKLIAAAPPRPVAERLPQIQGVWRQVWGPYDYRSNKRGVDPEFGVKEIYQVVFEGGYYYNAAYLYSGGEPRRERIALLRGEYRPDTARPDLLRVRFTRYPGAATRPASLKLWELPAMAEAGTLAGEISIVPTWIVRLFFGGGALREAYTDETLRITYGSNGRNFEEEYIYVMERVTTSAK